MVARTEQQRQSASGQHEQQNKCEHFVERKGRKCGFTTASGSRYCGNHDPGVVRERCSECGTAVAALDKHLLRCPARMRAQRTEREPYYSAGINRGGIHEEDSAGPLSAPAHELLRRVDEAFHSLPDELKHPAESFHAAHGQEDLAIWTAHVGQDKHSTQQGAILRQLELVDAFADPVLPRAYVEFGCGRGYLSLVLAEKYASDESSFVLVDRETPRFRADRKLRQDKVDLERLKIDIADLRLESVRAVKRRRHFVAMSKHLCGEATDLALRCCLEGSRRGPLHMDALVFAPCCRHRCRWSSFFARDVFEEWGFDPPSFRLVANMCSWAVSGGRKGYGAPRTAPCSGESDTSSEDDVSCAASVDVLVTDVFPSSASELSQVLDVDGRDAVGFKCARLIDAARVIALRRQELDVRLLRYCASAVSPENFLLVALPQS
mmetsp:Transcript_10501/g.32114  ORF Transcript_10501/g.32114 Transcript_10501/m.32114 type:complete len:436 (-) Transcript_10501:1093-2400(-)